MTNTILKATDIKASYELMEEYFQVSIPPIAENVNDCFISIEREVGKQKQPELFSVSPDNKILHCYPDKNSHSGWGHKEIAVPGAPDSKIEKLLAFWLDDRFFLLVHYANKKTSYTDSKEVYGYQRIATMVLHKGKWIRLNEWNDILNIKNSGLYCNDKGEHFLYGSIIEKKQNGFPVYNNQGDPKFAVYAMPNMAIIGDSSFVKCGEMTNDDNSWLSVLSGIPKSKNLRDHHSTYILTDASYRSVEQNEILLHSTAEIGYFGGPYSTQSIKLNGGDLRDSRIIPIPETTNASLLVQSKKGELFYICDGWGNHKTVPPITGGDNQPKEVLKVSVSKNTEGQCLIYAIDSKDRYLWLLRQNNKDSKSPTFGEWVKLGDPVLDFSVPSETAAAAEIFIVFSDLDDQKIKIKHLHQDAETMIWHSEILATSTTKQNPEKHNVYAVELTVVDKNDIPVPDVALDISSNRKSIIYANGFAYHVDGRQKATCMSDKRGTVTIKTKAVSLTSPEIKVHCGAYMDDSETRIFCSDTHAHFRLAGKDKNFEVSEDSLRNQAKIIPSKIGSKKQNLAKQLPDALKHIGNAMVKKNENDSSNTKLSFTADEQGGFEFDFTSPDAPVVNVFDATQATAIVAHLEQHGEGGIKDFFGDIIHACKHFYHELKKITIYVLEDAIHLVIHAFNNMKRIVVKSMDELGAMLESLLNKVEHLFELVENAIASIIHWLSKLFSWDDILKTKDVYKYYINTLLKNLEADLGDKAVTFIKHNFKDMQSAINTSFAEGESLFEKQSFNAFTSDDVRKKQMDRKSLHHKHSVRSNYILHHSQSFLGKSLKTKMLNQSTGDAFKELEDFIKKNMADDVFKKSFSKIETWFSNIQNPATFFETLICTFMEIIKDLVDFTLDIVEELLEIFMKLLSEMCGFFKLMLNQEIDIPFVSWLYKEITKSSENGHKGDALTLLDLISLVIAIPATIFYKVSHDNSPPITSVKDITSQASFSPFKALNNKDIGASDDDLKVLLKGLCALSYESYWLCRIPSIAVNSQGAGHGGEVGEAFCFVYALGIQGFSLEGILPISADSKTPEKLAVSQWFLYILPLLVSPYTIWKHSDENKNSDWINLFMGAVIFALGLAVTIEGKKENTFNNYDYTEAIVVPIDIIVPSLVAILEKGVGLEYISNIANLVGGACHLASGHVR